MDAEIWAALITSIAAVIVAIINKIDTKKYRREVNSYMTDNSFVRFWRKNDVFNTKLLLEERICMYTVNSFEMRNNINQILSQNPKIIIKNIILLVRRKPDEKSEDVKQLDDIIAMWQGLVRAGRIKKLEIIKYDHDSDHYYTLFGNRFAMCGHVYSDSTKPTGTSVDYIPTVITDENEIGQQLIDNFQKHFDNLVATYKQTSVVYTYEKHQ